MGADLTMTPGHSVGVIQEVTLLLNAVTKSFWNSKELLLSLVTFSRAKAFLHDYKSTTLLFSLFQSTTKLNILRLLYHQDDSERRDL